MECKGVSAHFAWPRLSYQTPEISVIIPTFNRWPMVSEAVLSVLAQRGVRLELIVVDDGSADSTAAGLTQIVEHAGEPRHAFHLVRTGNHGPAAARNTGAALARAPLIAFLDSDDLWMPTKLKRQLDWMAQAPGCVLVQTEEIWLRNGRRVNPGRRHCKRSGDFFVDSLRTCLISPSAMMMKTSLFQQLGGFDVDMRAAEDYDLWLRLLVGYPAELIPEALVIRRAGHPGQLSASTAAIDRFRILALLKLLAQELGSERRQAVCAALIEKCRIYGQGAARRGRLREARFVEHLSAMAESVWQTFAGISLERAIADLRFALRRNRSILREQSIRRDGQV